MYKIPILLISFNRPTYTRQVLETVLAIEPKDLYIFQDGPRRGNETDVAKCAEVRQVVEELTNGKQVDLHTNYRDLNLGCGPGPAHAITWFFDHVEEGIILEDDCLPSREFFQYCQELLGKYENEPSIGFIGGANYGYTIKNDTSYVFGSGHHQTWGWATWRRSWELFDYKLEGLGKKDFDSIVRHYYKSARQRDYWREIFDLVKTDRMNDSCWDYQFYFSMWARNKVAICPKVNLVSNVGFGADATHTDCQDSPLLNRKVERIMPLIHPETIKHDFKVDDFMMRRFIIPYEYGMGALKSLPYRINKRIKRLVWHKGPWFKKKR